MNDKPNSTANHSIKVQTPTAKQIARELQVSGGQAMAIRAVMKAYLWNGGPDPGALLILNTMLNAHGVESFEVTTKQGKHYVVYYLNEGDTYRTTILYIVPAKGSPRYEIGCWGDWAEKQK